MLFAKATVFFLAIGILQAMMICQASHNNVHALALASRPVIVRYFAFNRCLLTETVNQDITGIFILPGRDALPFAA